MIILEQKVAALTDAIDSKMDKTALTAFTDKINSEARLRQEQVQSEETTLRQE